MWYLVTVGSHHVIRTVKQCCLSYMAEILKGEWLFRDYSSQVGPAGFQWHIDDLCMDACGESIRLDKRRDRCDSKFSKTPDSLFAPVKCSSGHNPICPFLFFIDTLVRSIPTSYRKPGIHNYREVHFRGTFSQIFKNPRHDSKGDGPCALLTNGRPGSIKKHVQKTRLSLLVY